jgi:hypothetical protein
MKITIEGKADVIDFETGKALFLNEQSHEVENLAQTTVELLVVELKK